LLLFPARVNNTIELKKSQEAQPQAVSEVLVSEAAYGFLPTGSRKKGQTSCQKKKSLKLQEQLEA
jgi:hypothetical protein